MKPDERLRRSIHEAFLDGDVEDLQALERELAGREDLLAEYRELKQLWDQLASLPEPDVPARVRARARRVILNEFRGRGGRAWRLLGGAAAAVVLFVGGFLFGSADGPVTDSLADAEYVFLIRGRVPAELEEEVAFRMAAWARELATEGRLAFAERLWEDSAVWVGSRQDANGREPPVSGLFLVSAENLAVAQRLARASPHLSFGGAVEVLPLAHE